MQPYQEASEEYNRQGAVPIQAAGAIGSAALTLGAIGKRVLPFLNKHIPSALAVQGLGKINPKIQEFTKMALDLGYTSDNIRDFIGSKVESEASQQPAKEKRNIIEQESPELHQFMLNEIKKGRTPMAAGALVALPGKERNDFRKVISKLTKSHKLSWAEIIDSVYGASGSQQSNVEPGQQSPEMGEDTQTQQMGPGTQNLYRILQEINNKGL